MIWRNPAARGAAIQVSLYPERSRSCSGLGRKPYGLWRLCTESCGTRDPRGIINCGSIALKALGEFAVTCDGLSLPLLPTKKARALVAFLVMHRAADVSREQLLEVFWRDFDPQRGRDNLNATLWSIRRMFRNAAMDPDEVIRTDRTVIRWHAAVDFDVDRLLQLSEKMDSAAAEEALTLYHGDFLEGVSTTGR